jgi:hypothetical protein
MAMMLALPAKLAPVTFWPWQVAQLAVLALCRKLAPAKVVIPPLAPAAGISIEGTLLVWQTSQATDADTGMWAGLRLAMFFGTTPKIVAALAPWQLAQPLVTPLWL